MSPPPPPPPPFQYLSDADERLRWQANALPTDDLCTENAIMIQRFNRYPLIVDPSGQATAFIMNEYKDKKISKTRYDRREHLSFGRSPNQPHLHDLATCTCIVSHARACIVVNSNSVYVSYMWFISLFSFLDDAFRKNLESALRFGNPLLVQVKSIDTSYVYNIYTLRSCDAT